MSEGNTPPDLLASPRGFQELGNKGAAYSLFRDRWLCLHGTKNLTNMPGGPKSRQRADHHVYEKSIDTSQARIFLRRNRLGAITNVILTPPDYYFFHFLKAGYVNVNSRVLDKAGQPKYPTLIHYALKTERLRDRKNALQALGSGLRSVFRERFKNPEIEEGDVIKFRDTLESKSSFFASIFNNFLGIPRDQRAIADEAVKHWNAYQELVNASAGITEDHEHLKSGYENNSPAFDLHFMEITLRKLLLTSNPKIFVPPNPPTKTALYKLWRECFLKRFPSRTPPASKTIMRRLGLSWIPPKKVFPFWPVAWTSRQYNELNKTGGHNCFLNRPYPRPLRQPVVDLRCKELAEWLEWFYQRISRQKWRDRRIHAIQLAAKGESTIAEIISTSGIKRAALYELFKILGEQSLKCALQLPPPGRDQGHGIFYDRLQGEIFQTIMTSDSRPTPTSVAREIERLSKEPFSRQRAYYWIGLYRAGKFPDFLAHQNQ